MAASYLWSTVLTPWLLVQDGAILTASPASLAETGSRKNFDFSTIIKIKVFSKLCYSPRHSFHSSF
jgi:hypothetical protein